MKLDVYHNPNFRFKIIENNQLKYITIRLKDEYSLYLNYGVNKFLIFQR